MAGKIPLKKIKGKIKRFAKGKIAVGLAIALVGFLAFYVPQHLNTFNYLQTTTMGVGAIAETAKRFVFGFILVVFGIVNDIVMSLFTGIIGLMKNM
jgi:hypothetical protein